MGLMLAQIFRSALRALGRELAAWRTSRDRALFGARAVLSVALAVQLANQLHLTNTWWAAISAFVVAQTSWSDSLKRAIQRLLGTVLGAGLGTLLGPWIGDRPWLFIPVLALIGGVAVYRGNQSQAAYAWLLGGITALMVTFEAHLLETLRATASFALMRIAEVGVGTASCVLVAAAFDLGLRWHLARRAPATAPRVPPAAAPPVPVAAVKRVAVLLGVHGALAMAVLAALTYELSLPGLMQGMVTVVAVLILPQAALVVPGRRPVVEKMTQRLIGCLLAGALGLALLPLMQGAAVACMVALSLGIWMGCHVQTGLEGATYIGRQFTIAFIMVFVQDHGWSADPGPALLRLAGILAGIAVLAVVMITTRRVPGAWVAQDAVA
jgi:uncharacterized membrane protein YccC